MRFSTDLYISLTSLTVNAANIQKNKNMPVIPFSPLGLTTGLLLKDRFKLPHRFKHKTIQLTFRVASLGLTFDLPVDPLVSVEQPNTIICRQAVSAVDKQGSVKEFFSVNDFSINISGLLMSDSAHCVDDYCQQLRTIAQCGKPVEIICPYINDTFGVQFVVIESLKFPFTEGEENQQFVIQCKSDTEYDLIIQK